MDGDCLHELFQELPTVGLILDRQLRIRDINNYGCTQLGYARSELIGSDYSMLCVPEERQFIRNNLLQCLQDCPSQRRWENVRLRKDGSRYWVRDTVRIITHGNGEPVVLIASEDITETRYLISELERKSTMDELTGLENRRRFNRHLNELLLAGHSEEESHVLFLIDLDQFKTINEICGRKGGDQILIQVADLLREHTRHGDMLARLGDDEFGLILRFCAIDEARQIGNKLLRALAQHRFTWECQRCSIGASIGAALIEPGSEVNADELLRQAEAACSLAKDRGHQRIELYDGSADARERCSNLQNWYNQIHHALEQSLFLLFSQELRPISKHIQGEKAREVLIRMQGENGEIISPALFIPAADYYHLTPRIDQWVIEEVVRHFLSLPGTDDGTYFINLSGPTLSDQQYIKTASELLSRYKGKGLKICFEITEAAAIRHFDSARHFIDTFKSLGCRFALDDFGSGLSSFGYLKNLPVDIIKIDGQFVRNIADDPVDRAVVIAVQGMARALHMQTVAEFVENEAALKAVKDIGIDFAQGYHIEKPHPLFGDKR